jgi:hypothetical protein
MEVDTRFPSKLDTVNDVPEPLRGKLVDNIHSQESVRLLVHAPAFSTANEKSPATVLAVTEKDWIVASEAEDGGVSVAKSNFNDTLFLELTSIILLGQLRIGFASEGTSYSTTMRFDTLGEEFYHEAIDVLLNDIDQTSPPAAENDLGDALITEAWPIQFRIEAQRYRPKGQRLLTATQWPAIIDGLRRELSPAGALLVTERELVLIAEEKASPRLHSGDSHKFGGIITYFPLVRLADFNVVHQEQFSILALEVHATSGGEKLEIIFPSNQARAVAKAMEQARVGCKHSEP